MPRVETREAEAAKLTAPPLAAPAPSSAKEVASDFGGGATEARLISKLSSRYGVEPSVIGAKANKAAELCRNQPKPGKSGNTVRLISDSLYFAENASRDGLAPDILPLDDAFVMFVVMGCRK